MGKIVFSLPYTLMEIILDRFRIKLHEEYNHDGCCKVGRKSSRYVLGL